MDRNKKLLQFFSALADETRLNILTSLADKPKTVNEIHARVNKISLSAISHQLKHLSDLEIINYEKKGREKYFSLSKNFCWCILKDGFKHFEGKGCKKCMEVRG